MNAAFGVTPAGGFEPTSAPTGNCASSGSRPGTVKGRPRVDGSAAKARCRVLAFTGMRPSELMRYRPEHRDLRHSFGTALYRAAGDTRLVKDLLGHSDSRMTERYTLGHVPEAMRAATAVFESQLGGREMLRIVPDNQSGPSKLPGKVSTRRN